MSTWSLIVVSDIFLLDKQRGCSAYLLVLRSCNLMLTLYNPQVFIRRTVLPFRALYVNICASLDLGSYHSRLIRQSSHQSLIRVQFYLSRE